MRRTLADLAQGEKVLDCRITTDEDGLDQLQSQWDAVCASDPSASFFQQWEWNRVWWRWYGKRCRPLVVTFCDGADVVGLAPLCTSRAPSGHQVARFLGTGPSDYGDIIARPERREEVASALARLALGEMGLVFDLQQIREDSPNLFPLEKALERAGASPRKLVQERAFSLDLPGSWEELLAGLGSKTRYNLKYYRRRLHRDFQVELVDAPAEGAIDESMEIFFRLHQRRWRKRFLPGLFLFPGYRRYHLDVARSFRNRGQLLLYRLRLDGREAAAFYGFRHAGADYFYLGGFDPDYSRLSVGTVLVGEMIARAIGAGSRRFEFLRGDEAYKSRWRAAGKTNYRLLAAPESVRSSLYLAVVAKENTLILKAKNRLRSGL